MGISTFTGKEFVIFCRLSKIGNAKLMHWVLERRTGEPVDLEQKPLEDLEID
jgi:hypothetical protein